jgi:hypothetical protein
MKAIITMTLTAMLMASGMAEEDEDAGKMEAFVGGVYGEKGFAVILSKDQALVNGKLILRNGDVYTTPKGTYTDNHGVYSCPRGIVSRNGDIFSGSTGIRYGSGDVFFGSGGATIVSGGASSSMRKP